MNPINMQYLLPCYDFHLLKKKKLTRQKVNPYIFLLQDDIYNGKYIR